MKNIAIVPARSGSKGLINKNVKLLLGKPLMAYSIEAAIESKCFDTVHVSTDLDEYAEIARQYGAEVLFLRNKESATDTASSWDAVREVIEKYKILNKFFDCAMLLQPTSPLRTSTDIKNAFSLMDEKGADSILSVCKTDHSPLWSNTLPIDHSLKSFIQEDVVNTPRQKLDTYYQINGAIYLIKTELLSKAIDLYSENSYALIMDRISSIDIDDEFDFVIAEAVMNLLQRKRVI